MNHMKTRKQAEEVEDPQAAFQRFEESLRRALTVPKSEILRLEKADKQERAKRREQRAKLRE